MSIPFEFLALGSSQLRNEILLITSSSFVSIEELANTREGSESGLNVGIEAIHSRFHIFSYRNFSTLPDRPSFTSFHGIFPPFWQFILSYIDILLLTLPSSLSIAGIFILFLHKFQLSLLPHLGVKMVLIFPKVR